MVKLLAFDRAPRMDKNPSTRARNKSIEYSIYLTCVSFCTISLSLSLSECPFSAIPVSLRDGGDARRDSHCICDLSMRARPSVRSAARTHYCRVPSRAETYVFCLAGRALYSAKREQNIKMLTHTRTDQRCVPTHTTK